MNDGNNGATLNVDKDLSNLCQSISTSITSLSQSLSQLTNTPGNVVSIPTTQSAALNIYINAINNKGISVLNLDGNTVLNNAKVQQIEIIINSNIDSTLKLVVINLLGNSISFSQGNFVGDWLKSERGQSHTIWNFPQATTIDNSNSKEWDGSILAPYATATNSGLVNGAVAVYSLITSAAIANPPIIVPECV